VTCRLAALAAWAQPPSGISVRSAAILPAGTITNSVGGLGGHPTSAVSGTTSIRFAKRNDRVHDCVLKLDVLRKQVLDQRREGCRS
jgi:hypothetical protein